MRLFNLEAHISVIADIENIFHRLYPDIEITSWNISGHNHVFNREPAEVEIINSATWKFLDQKMITQFHQRYDSFLRSFDGFICGFPPVFALLFERYQKPIFMINATRYEMPFCWQPNPKMQDFYEQRMRAMHASGQLVVVNNNKGDQAYLEQAVGISGKHIPSLCLYTQANYQPKKDQFIVTARRAEAQLPDLEGTLKLRGLGRYEWQDLYSYRGLIHMPYEISTMSIFEQYSANIPLIMPSQAYLSRLLKNKKIPFNGPYTRENYDRALEPILGPNWVEFWLPKADFYDSDNMPFITYYDNYAAIPELLKSVDTETVSARMKAHNRTRQRRVLESWRTLLRPHYRPPSAPNVFGLGQIHHNNHMGRTLIELAKIEAFTNYLEIGSWNGQGSTVCLMRGLLSRNDNSQLFSVELMPEMFKKAEQHWSWLPKSAYAHQLQLLEGKIVDKGMMSETEIKSHPHFSKVEKHFSLYYNSDVEQFSNAENIADKLPANIDVAVLDGGEFCSYAEYQYLQEHHSPKVFVLDDTHVIKCHQIRTELKHNPDWVEVFDRPNDRHGTAMYVRKKYARAVAHLFENAEQTA